jgi:hypothetical protein
MKLQVNDLVCGKTDINGFGIVTRILKFDEYKLDENSDNYWAEVLWENKIISITKIKHLTKIDEAYNEDYKRKLSNT